MRLVDQLKRISQKRFVRDVSILQFGNLFSFGLAAINSIVFARLLGSENYGVYSLAFAFFGLVGIFMNVGVNYTVLTLLPAAYAKKDKKEVTNILSYCFYILILIFLTVGLLAIGLAPFFAKLLYHQMAIGQLARYLILASNINILFFMVTSILQSIRKIKNLTLYENLNKLIYLVMPVFFILLGFGVWGIVFGHFISSIVFFIASFFYFEYLAAKNEFIPSFGEMIKNFKEVDFKRYFKLGFLVAMDKNLNNLYTILPVTFLGMLAASVSQVSYFKIATGYLALPALFLTPIARILTVQLPKSLVYGGKIFKDNFRKSSLVSGLLFILLLVPFVALAPFLIKLFYGHEYEPAAKLVYFVFLGDVFFGFTVGYSSFFRTLNKLKSFIVSDLLMILTGILFFFVISHFLSPLRSVMILFVYFNVGVALVQGALIVKYFKEIKD